MNDICCKKTYCKIVVYPQLVPDESAETDPADDQSGTLTYRGDATW